MAVDADFSDRHMDAGAVGPHCIEVFLPQDAANGLQGSSSKIEFTIDATMAD